MATVRVYPKLGWFVLTDDMIGITLTGNIPRFRMKQEISKKLSMLGYILPNDWYSDSKLQTCEIRHGVMSHEKTA